MKRAGFVTLIGQPNAGKSTLLNQLIGSKIAIVTHKVQTTRTRLRGIKMHGDTQIVFIDTPGLFPAKRKLERAMIAAAWGGVNDADIVILLIEAQRSINEGIESIIAQLAKRITKTQKILLAINKIDRVPREKLLHLAAEMHKRFDFEKTFMISATKGYGVDYLLDYLGQTLPRGPYLYPTDQIADMPMRLIAAEITREKLLLRLHQEIPYDLTVETQNWQKLRDKSLRIDQTIYVARPGHKGIILGPAGQTIKEISIAARKDIAMMIEEKIHLFINVKLRPNWENNAQHYSEIGLNFKDTQ